jgi:hypothetical protein
MAHESSRPRRSARCPQRFLDADPPAVVSTSTGSKRKRADDSSTDHLSFLLKNPKSLLTEIDISVSYGFPPCIISRADGQTYLQDLLNVGAWNLLSPEAHLRLVDLLPPTAFHTYEPKMEPSHPSQSISSISSTCPSPHETTPHETTTPLRTPDVLDAAVFTDSHFLAAAHTFQDHLYSDGLSDATEERVHKFQTGIQSGTLHAPWKDEVWLRNNPPLTTESSHAAAGPESMALAGCV